MRKTLEPVLLIWLAASALQADSIKVNWADRTIDCPSELEYDRRVAVKVVKLNDLVYNYDIQATARTSWADDFANIGGIFTAEAGKTKAVADCDDLKQAEAAVQAVSKALETATKPEKLESGKYKSIKLETTIEAWNQIEASDDFKNAVDLLKKLEKPSAACASADRFAERLATVQGSWKKIMAFRDRVKGPHEWNGSLRLTPGANHAVSVQVEESFKGVTDKGSQEFKCEIKSALLSLSAGPLFSALANRKYSVVDIPKVDPKTGLTLDETYKGLAVENAKPSALAATALLNFAIPKATLSAFALHATSGPVLRQSSTGSSSFGYFAGISLSIAKRFFVTYGVQRSQFADFPVGYSQNSFVPPSIGTNLPQASNRWTTRPAWAITYRTNSFGTFTSTKPEVKGDDKNPAGGSAGNQKPDSPKPAEESKPADPAKESPGATGSGGTDAGGNEFQPEAARLRSAPQVLAVRFSGKNCWSETGAAPAYAWSQDRLKVSVLFEGLQSRAAGQWANCEVQVTVAVPRGRRLSVLGSDYRWATPGAQGSEQGRFRVQHGLISRDLTELSPAVTLTNPQTAAPSLPTGPSAPCAGRVTAIFRIAVEASTATLATVDSLDFDLANPKHAEVFTCAN